MDPTIIIFLSSGLFLGWALGANDAANVFGTAVGTRMVRWGTAAVICSVFVVLGAVVSGAGSSHTLGKLGAISALPGAFMTALAAAISVYLMTKAGLAVSTSQAIVGGIVGWNMFTGQPTDTKILTTIITTWFLCPVLSAVIAVILYKALRVYLRHAKLHLVRTDAYLRLGLLIAGAFGAYALGANNIANVVGVFIPATPFPDVQFAGFTFTAAHQLFLAGGLAIAVGVMTYSKRVMMTVGGGLGRISPIAAFIAVISHSIVLFAFASRGLEAWLLSMGLPTIPLVPVSSSQAVVGAIIGIAILQGASGIRWRVLGNIVMGWIATPIMAGFICFFGLFFLQNVFDLTVF
jgi:PiT family inorganic phosphate transporter